MSNVIRLIVMDRMDGMRFITGKRYMRMWFAKEERHYLVARKK